MFSCTSHKKIFLQTFYKTLFLFPPYIIYIPTVFLLVQPILRTATSTNDDDDDDDDDVLTYRPQEEVIILLLLFLFSYYN